MYLSKVLDVPSGKYIRYQPLEICINSKNHIRTYAL